MDEVMELSCVTEDTDSWPWRGIPSADVSNCTQHQEYPQPSALRAIQSIQCFTGFIECEMSKYFSLELFSRNRNN